MLSTELFVLFYRCYLQIVYTGDISIHSVKRSFFLLFFFVTVATYKLYIPSDISLTMMQNDYDFFVYT